MPTSEKPSVQEIRSRDAWDPAMSVRTVEGGSGMRSEPPAPLSEWAVAVQEWAVYPGQLAVTAWTTAGFQTSRAVVSLGPPHLSLMERLACGLLSASSALVPMTETPILYLNMGVS